ncbi:MAG: hypothetical protein BWY91_03247 [bacterium ADurb.BinA028]|nr:MAG: hypothetical protein BWY91_03247 [bacterium ADurb.BinA028]
MPPTIQQGADEGGKDDERCHRRHEEQRDLAACLAKWEGQDRAGQRHGEGCVARRGKDLHLGDPAQARLGGAFRSGEQPEPFRPSLRAPTHELGSDDDTLGRGLARPGGGSPGGLAGPRRRPTRHRCRPPGPFARHLDQRRLVGRVVAQRLSRLGFPRGASARAGAGRGTQAAARIGPRVAHRWLPGVHAPILPRGRRPGGAAYRGFPSGDARSRGYATSVPRLQSTV